MSWHPPEWHGPPKNAPGKGETSITSTQIERILTSEEAAADGSDDNLETEKAAHGVENIATLLVDGMNADDMHERASREEDSCADGFEQEEVRALL